MDREKVIKGLETCKSSDKTCSDCPYNGDVCTTSLCDDVLVLLKEQEAIEPDVDSEGTCTCGNCGETVGWYPVGSKEPVRFGKFCSECGRAVKWE